MEKKPRTLYVAVVKNGDAENFFGAVLFGGMPMEQRIQVSHKDPAPPGEAMKKAKEAVQDRDIRKTWILFGDPATKLKY